MPTDETIAREVRAELARQRRTQDDVAAHLRIGQPAVSRRLKAQVPFTAAELASLAIWLDVPLAQLLGKQEAAS